MLLVGPVVAAATAVQVAILVAVLAVLAVRAAPAVAVGQTFTMLVPYMTSTTLYYRLPVMM